MKNPIEDIADLDTYYDNEIGWDCPAASCSADPMRGFRFVTFKLGANKHECPECGFAIFSRGPWDFVPKADKHRKTCKHDAKAD